MLDASATDKLIFSLEGISVKIHCEQENFCLPELKLDFSFFLDTPSQMHLSHQISLEIIAHKPEDKLLPAVGAKEVHAEYVVYETHSNESGKMRWIDYHGEALLCTKEEKKSSTAKLWCANSALCHELAYLYLLSRIGVFLDQLGLHRVHALGFHAGSSGALVLIPSGGGKSSIALNLIQNKSVRLLSDDSPLVDRKGNLHPFPLRMAFRKNTKLPDELEKSSGLMKRRKYGEKKLIPVNALPYPPEKQNTVIQPKLLVIAERHGSKSIPKMRKISKQKALQALLRDMVVGLGLPQLAELVLTKGIWTIPSLLPTATSRMIAATQLVLRSKCFALELSTDREANAETLYEKLAEYQLK